MKAFFFLNFHQNNVVADLTDTFPRNDKLAFPAEKIAEFPRSGNDQGSQTAGFAVKFNIYGTAETAAGAGVDDFFLFQFT